MEDIYKLKDKLWRLQNLYKIKTKTRKVIPFRLNETQLNLFNEVKDLKPIRYFNLKARQIGFSTFWLLYWLDDTLFNPNTNTGVLAHKWESLKYLMDIIKLAYDTMPESFKPKLGSDSAHELSFADMNSKIFVSLNIQSIVLHNLHISEWCLCDDQNVRASLAAVTPDGNITGESIGNGVGNDGYMVFQESKLGENGFKCKFHPWFLQTEYQLPAFGQKVVPDIDEKNLTGLMLKSYGKVLTPEQIMWRRKTKREQKENFKRYFPETEEDAFYAGVNRYFETEKIFQLLKDIQLVKKDFAEVTDDYTKFENRQLHDIYAGAADTAEGGGDYSVVKIINVTKRREAFVYRARCGVDTFYRICDKWGRYYNNCIFAPERNNHGHAVILGMYENCKYPNLFKQESHRIGQGLEKFKLGWLTTAGNKTTMCDELKFAIEGDSTEDVEHFSTEFTVYDEVLLKEALTFTAMDGKLGADVGKYDDDIMATAIAYQMYKKMRRYTNINRENFGILIGQGENESNKING